MKKRVTAAVLAIVLAGCAGPPASPVASAAANVDPTGILLLATGEQVQGRPPNEAVTQAHSDAMVMAEANGLDLGYPWIDSATGQLVLSAATPRGRQLIEAAAIAVPYRIRSVEHGFKALEEIKDGVTFLGGQGIEGAELIFMSGQDHRDNRALIGIREMSRPLLDHLAATYPADAIAVQVDPMFGGGGTT
jgi:hypothetical protein